tara:strand:+ start:92 stop:346 length:255 start_codon:yes stop_codon:yes gene_type:complete
MSEESQGLGDTVEKIITTVGNVTKIEWIRKKKGCDGCRKRKEALNNAFPYKKSETTSESEEAPCTDCEEKKKKKGGCSSCGKNK